MYTYVYVCVCVCVCAAVGKVHISHATPYWDIKKEVHILETYSLWSG